MEMIEFSQFSKDLEGLGLMSHVANGSRQKQTARHNCEMGQGEVFVLGWNRPADTALNGESDRCSLWGGTDLQTRQ